MLNWILEHFRGFTRHKSKSAYFSHLLLPTLAKEIQLLVLTSPTETLAYTPERPSPGCRRCCHWLLSWSGQVGSHHLKKKSSLKIIALGFPPCLPHLLLCALSCSMAWGSCWLIAFSPAAVPDLIKILVQASRWTKTTQQWRDNIFYGPTVTAGLSPLTDLAVTSGAHGAVVCCRKTPSSAKAGWQSEKPENVCKNRQVSDHLLE